MLVPKFRFSSELFYYYLLFCIFYLSILVFAFLAVIHDSITWKSIVNIFGVMGVIYTWYVIVLLFNAERKEKTKDFYPKYNGEKISVLVPCYNEPPELLLRSIRSVYKARGNKQIIIINDGSNNTASDYLIRLARKEGITVHHFMENKGKRHALHHGVRSIFDDTKYVVTIDSDTILDKNALVRIVEPLKKKNIGAVSGNVFLLNEKQNLLTRAIGAYYWKALNINRKAQSSLGIVGCCSGCLAAYRIELISDVMNDLINQEFLGKKCTYSEDRHLTNLILKKGYNVTYRKDAISHTHSPHKLKAFLKQQMRWRRGFIKESTFTLSYAWKKHPILFLQTLLWDLTMPFAVTGLMIATTIEIFINPIFFITILLPSWILFSSIRSLPLIFDARDKILGMFIFILLYEFILYWQSIIALFTLKNDSWSTR